jgi:hypothetical protein
MIGSRNGQNIGFFDLALLPGDYTLEVESVDPGFTDGSSVGPLSPPIPNPGVHEFWDAAESNHEDPNDRTTIHVSAGVTLVRNIILNGTLQRLDNFEDDAALIWLDSPSSTPGKRGGL